MAVKMIVGAILSLMLAGAAGAEEEAWPLFDLPEGPLQLVGGNAKGANFIDLEKTVRDGDLVELWHLHVSAVPLSLGNTDRRRFVAQWLEQGRLDCKGRTYERLNSVAFNEAGERVLWMGREEPEPIEASSGFDFFARVLCDGVELPQTNTLVGHEAARAATRLLLGVQQP